MRRLYFRVLLLSAIIFCATPVQAGGTLITSDITTDTTWDLSGSPYTVTTTINVLQGVTLTIQPGVVVQFAGNYTLQVDGTLLADTVTFTSAKTSPAKGDWQWIKFTLSSGSSSSVSNSLVEYATYGLYSTGASPTISGNTIRMMTQYGIRTDGIASPLVTSNSITGCTTGGILAWASPGIFSPSIIGNTINGGSYGIYVYASGSPTRSHPILSNNTIAGATAYGIIYSGNIGGTIESGNTISDNGNGIYLFGGGTTGASPTPEIHNNNIYGNTNANLSASNFSAPAITVIDARNNWWGTTDPYVIGDKIIEYSDAPTTSPAVDWSGFLDAPYPQGVPVPGTYVPGGQVPCSSTWSAAGSPYILLGSPLVTSGCTLTIQPGAVVKFAGNYSLQVDGTLLADGTTFTSYKFTPATNDWHSIKFASSSGSGSSMTNSLVEYSHYGLYCVGASPTLRGNILRQNSYGIQIEGSASPVIQGNSFQGNSEGIYAGSGAVVNSTISGNTITGSTHGVYLYVLASPDQSRPYLSSNTISGNGWGISYYGNVGGTIEGNIIINNNIGIPLYGINQEGKSPLPVIRSNSIHDNITHIQASGYLSPATTSVDARYNWFGTIDGPEIENKIVHYPDAPTSSPTILWEPYLDGPQGNPVMWIWIHTPIPFAFSPGVETVDFSSHVAEPSDWQVLIRDFATGQVVRSYYGSSSTSVTFTWSGEDNTGALLPGGWYAWSIETQSTGSGAIGITQTSYLLASAITAPTITIHVTYPLRSTVAHVSGNYIFFPTTDSIKGDIRVALLPDPAMFHYQQFSTVSGSYSFDYDTCGLSYAAYTLSATAVNYRNGKYYQSVATAPLNKVQSVPEISISSIKTVHDTPQSFILTGSVDFFDTTWSKKGETSVVVKRSDTGETACAKGYSSRETHKDFATICPLCNSGQGEYSIILTAKGCGFTQTLITGVEY